MHDSADSKSAAGVNRYIGVPQGVGTHQTPISTHEASLSSEQLKIVIPTFALETPEKKLSPQSSSNSSSTLPVTSAHRGTRPSGVAGRLPLKAAQRLHILFIGVLASCCLSLLWLLLQNRHPGGIAKALWKLPPGMSRFWVAYNSLLVRRPLFTKILTGIVGTTASDVIAQLTAHKMGTPTKVTTPPGPARSAKEKPTFRYDMPRLLRLLMWTVAVGTPLAHYWFLFLDTQIMPATPRSPSAVVVKLLLDQGVMAPLGTALFFMGMKVMEGSPHLAIPEMRAKLWPVMCANWMVWPLANAINFYLCPPNQRILFVNIIAVAWGAFMSHTAFSPAVPPDTPGGTTQLASRRGGGPPWEAPRAAGGAVSPTISMPSQRATAGLASPPAGPAATFAMTGLSGDVTAAAAARSGVLVRDMTL